MALKWPAAVLVAGFLLCAATPGAAARDTPAHLAKAVALIEEGDAEAAQAILSDTVSASPDDLLARAHLGRAFIALGDIEAARAQLTEIRRRGGRASWPEFLLRSALGNGPRAGY
ncbi:Tetratricopeptide repeat-containing protein [Palleronia salina]|uniref:Tetratricopeptide repeat-containing protein n=1 Tax=Palleronia salina TaxID=313368 RepID=A0A1M6L5K3_9RHOB|nr:tetratricopeptide repeat protein [Palleronia salina]SHJ66480.1 Tetratricopeptide repeat-containing protein [Palleronia salina]